MRLNRAAALAVLLVTIGTAASAQEVFLRGDELKNFVSGKTFKFPLDGTGGASLFATYKASGQYEFHNDGYNTKAFGKWNVKDDLLCIDFTDNRTRCDRVVRESDGRLMWKQTNGKKYRFTVQ